MNMHDPAHPGEIIRKLCLEPLGLTVTQAAKALVVTRKALSELVNCRAGISVEMALRLAKAFDTSAESWLAMQQQYDLARARKRVRLGKVRRLKAA
jgi:addiction module HigA family antidote